MGAAPESTVEFDSTQDTIISGLASNMKLVAAALLVLAPLKLVYGGLDLGMHSHWLTGGLSLIEGLFSGLLGLIMLKGAADARYMVETKGYDKEHLLNLVESLTVFYRFQIGIGVIVLIFSALRFLF
jgi:hypothetical protein